MDRGQPGSVRSLSMTSDQSLRRVAIGQLNNQDSHLSGTIMAHAEMDALSQVPFGTRITGPLYTTFEPCVMCATTIAVDRVPEVRFAAADPFFDGLHDWMAGYPFTAERSPERMRPEDRSAPSAMSRTWHGWLPIRHHPMSSMHIDVLRLRPSIAPTRSPIVIASGSSAIEAPPSSKRYRSSGRTSSCSACDICPALYDPMTWDEGRTSWGALAVPGSSPGVHQAQLRVRSI